MALLEASGLPGDQARDAADAFLSTSLREVGHHDISFLPQRLDWLANHGVNPRPELRLVRSSPAAETWDGDRGLGEVCCTHVARRAVDLARANGVGYAAVRRSNHFLAASHYAQLGVDAGCFLLVFSNTDPCMAGPGGTRNIIGNDPFGYGLARAGQAPLVADMCMAYSSLGNLASLAAAGEGVPAYWGNDKAGHPSTDPRAILDGGTVNPMARHKGFALALMVEALTGLLAGGDTGNQVAPGGGVNTHNQAVLAFDLAAFGGAGDVAARAADLTDRLRADQPGLRFPGERSREARDDALARGVELKPALAEKLLEWSRRLGAAAPKELQP